jgi:hypothetical protein
MLQKLEAMRLEVEGVLKRYPNVMMALVLHAPDDVEPVSFATVMAPGYNKQHSIEFGGWAAELLSESMVQLAEAQPKPLIIQ